MTRSRLRARALRAAPILALLVVGAVARGLLVDRQGLWTDEYFSLAMATGHGLEHPAAAADPALGDFVERRAARPIEEYASYVAPDPAADVGRIVDAVRRSDTNPPLYYLALAGWVRAFGAGDVALRSWSVVASLLALPLVAWLARRAGGRRAVVPACALYALLPAAVYYGTEGRMYGQLLLLTAAVLALAVKLHRSGARPAAALGFVAVGVAGLLTHHFFLFPFATACVWLLVHPGRASRGAAVGLGLACGVLVAPWYVQLPGLMGQWRVTAGWLNMRPGDHHAALTPLGLVFAPLSTRGPWGGRPLSPDVLVHGAACLVAVAAALRAGATGRPTVRPASAGFGPLRRAPWSARAMAWVRRSSGPLARFGGPPITRLLLAAALTPALGVLLLDALMGTYAADVPRYALAALPATAVVVGVGLARLPARTRAVLLLVLALGCAAGGYRMARRSDRAGQPYRAVGALLARRCAPDDLLIIHSIPSGVVGLSREVSLALRGAPGPAVAAWVGQLGQRGEQDVAPLLVGRRRVFLVELHTVADPPLPRAWLGERATVEEVETLGAATITLFVPHAARERAAR